MLFGGWGMQNRHTLDCSLERPRGQGVADQDGSGGTAKPFLSDMASKEDRTEARVKAGGMRCQRAARLYARRSAGKINLVGKEGEDRFAILSFTLLSLKFAIW